MANQKLVIPCSYLITGHPDGDFYLLRRLKKNHEEEIASCLK
jgi:hypothetical protein